MQTSATCDTSRILRDGADFYLERALEVGEEKARDELLSFLQSQSEVDSVELGADGFSIWVFPHCDRQGVLIPYDTIPDWQLENDEDVEPPCLAPVPARPLTVDAIGYRNAVVFDFTDHETEVAGTFSSWQLERDQVFKTLSTLGVSVERPALAELTLADLIEMDSVGLLVSVGHGLLGPGGGAMWVPVDWDMAEAEAQKAGFSFSSDDCTDDCDLVEVVWAQSKDTVVQHTLVTPHFWREHLPELQDSLVLSLHGFQAYAEAGMAEAFQEKGAHTLVGLTGGGYAPGLPALVGGLFEGMVQEGWVVEGAIATLSAGDRTGIDGCVIPSRRLGANTLGFVSYVTLQFENVPEDAESVTVEATTTTEPAEIVATWDLSPSGEAVDMVSATLARSFVATIMGGTQEGSQAKAVTQVIDEPNELVTLEFTQRADPYTDYSDSWRGGDFTLAADSVRPNAVLKVTVNTLCTSQMVLRASHSDGALKLIGDQPCPEPTVGASNYIPGDSGKYVSNCVTYQDVNCIYGFCGPQQPNPPDGGARVQLTTEDMSDGVVTVCFHIEADLEAPIGVVEEPNVSPCGLVQGPCDCVSGPAVILNSSQLTAGGSTYRCGAAHNFVIEGSSVPEGPE